MLASGCISAAYAEPDTRPRRPAALHGDVARSRPARRTIHRARIRRIRAAGLIVVIAVIAAMLAHGLPASSSPTASPSPTATSAVDAPPGDDSGPLGEADGAVPDDTSVFDDAVPGVTRLDPGLLAALRRAATDAAYDGVAVVVDSGWRSPRYQERLLREAVATYGSEDEAARWVATPQTSAHVSGDAVDVGHSDATGWLSEHGAGYGLCQTYANEPWHYELRPGAVDQGCPPTYPDPTHDPRMQQG